MPINVKKYISKTKYGRNSTEDFFLYIVGDLMGNLWVDSLRDEGVVGTSRL